MNRIAAVLVTAAALLGACERVAHADTPPSVWDRAKDPNAGAIYKLHVQNEIVIHEPRTSVLAMSKIDLGQAVAQGARDRILRADPAIQNDPRIRFDLGALHEKLLNFPKAAEVLKKALEDAPNHPASDDAWHTLAEACGHLGDSTCEKDAYTELLKRETEDFRRTIPLLNLAEAEMHLGHLRDAIDGYREALRVSAKLPPNAGGNVSALAVWGLAVALDRSGDRVTGEQQARFAMSLENGKSVGEIPGTYFYPSYEVLWYDGLGAAAQARATPDRNEALKLWNIAQSRFTRYIDGAEKNKDPWVGIAKARLAQIMASRLETEKRPASPKPKQTDEEIVF